MQGLEHVGRRGLCVLGIRREGSGVEGEENPSENDRAKSFTHHQGNMFQIMKL